LPVTTLSEEPDNLLAIGSWNNIPLSGIRGDIALKGRAPLHIISSGPANAELSIGLNNEESKINAKR